MRTLLPREVLLVGILALALLSGADGCPFTVGTSSSTPSTDSPANGELDIGGPNGAVWQLSYGASTRLTVVNGTNTASEEVDPAGGPASLLDGTIDLQGFCADADVVCPQQLLGERAGLVQPASIPGRFLIGTSTRGPLARLNGQGLQGELAGTALSVALSVPTLKSDVCTWESGSTLLATASASDGQTAKANHLEGRITLRYPGDCLTLTGGGYAPAQSIIEISTTFVAERL